MSEDGLESHLISLKIKHRLLDIEIKELEKSYTVTDEIRRLKTQKLWIKDEIYRIENKLHGTI